jgi:type II secretory pathway component GspD/PulD (secretin)
MKPRCLILGAILLALVVAPSVGADPGREASAVLEEKVSIDLEDADVVDVLKSLEKLTNLKIPVSSPRKAGSITLKVRNVRIRTVLDAICDQIGATWSLDANATPARIRVDLPPYETKKGPASSPSLDEPISLSLADADVRDVLHVCSRVLDVQEDIGPGVRGSITIEIQNSPASRVLDEICQKAHCTWALDRAVSPAVLRVASPPGN